MSGCTVVLTATGDRCGRLAQSKLQSSRTGEWFYECDVHDTSGSFPIVHEPKSKTVFVTPFGGKKVRSQTKRRYILVGCRATAQTPSGTVFVVKRSDSFETLLKEVGRRGAHWSPSKFFYVGIDRVAGSIVAETGYAIIDTVTGGVV